MRIWHEIGFRLISCQKYVDKNGAFGTIRASSIDQREMAEKVEAFPKRRGVSIRTALVYAGALDAAVVRSGVFDVIIPFSRLLGLQMRDE